MRIFAIGDLHLPGGEEKPMDVFGSAWTDHPARIKEAWCRTVREEDLVWFPATSWAMTLEGRGRSGLPRVPAGDGRDHPR